MSEKFTKEPETLGEAVRMLLTQVHDGSIKQEKLEDELKRIGARVETLEDKARKEDAIANALEEQNKQNSENRKWLIGTAIAFLGFLIAALSGVFA